MNNCSGIDHSKDEGAQTHGTREAPLPVPDPRLDRYVESEYEEMGRVLGFYHRCFHALLKIDGKMIDRNVAREANGKHHVFYFDIDRQFREQGDKIRATVERLKKNRLRLSPKEKQLLEAIERSETGTDGA